MNRPEYPLFGLFNTEERLLDSSQVDQSFRIGIWFPFSYASSNQKYPTLYILDGEFAYGLATGLIPTLIGMGEIPELMVVGVAYQGISTWQEHSILRDRDYCPPGFQQSPHESRIGQFTQFFRQELIPFIEAEYRASPDDRALFGFSSGGLFTLHCLLTQPGLFRRHIAASCTWPGADQYLLDCESQYTAQPVHRPTDLYLSVGGLEEEMLPGFRTVTQVLQDRHYAGFRFFPEILEGEKHSSGVLAKTFLNGIRAVYQP